MANRTIDNVIEGIQKS